MIRFGVLGCGYFGGEFARAVTEMEEAKLEAVYSPGDSARRLSEELGCKRAESLAKIMENPDIDAVIIATPNDLHESQVKLAAAAGKHVFCEKPFALSASSAAEMVRACQEAKVTLMVGHILHFYPGIEAVKAMADRGDFGRILTMHVERTGWEEKKPEVSWKKRQDQSGGHLFHHIHEIDILQWLMGVPEKIYTVGGNLGHREEGFGDEDDVLLLTASFGERAAYATLQYGSGFRMGNHLIRINGSLAGAEIDFRAAQVRIVDKQGSRSLPLFSDEASETAIRSLFARTDGGIAYGLPSERPPEYILHSQRRELKLFCRVIGGAMIPEDKKDLFDGTSAINSVRIAQAGLAAKNRREAVLL